ncbi:MAG: YciE/YciF ferroxidase family protein [Gemmatimonadota bacterium]
MALGTLHDLMIHELKDLYSAERQLVQALPKMAKNATSEELQTAFTNHLAETEEHVSRLEQILETFGESPRGQKCEGMEGLIEESKSLLDEDADPEVLDAGLIVSAQKVEHYEIASYGAVCEYARIMGHSEALELLQQTLDEEKNADALLNSLAEGGINALAERDGQENMEGEDDEEVATEVVRPRAASKAGNGGRKASSTRAAKSNGSPRSKARR